MEKFHSSKTQQISIINGDSRLQESNNKFSCLFNRKIYTKHNLIKNKTSVAILEKMPRLESEMEEVFWRGFVKKCALHFAFEYYGKCESQTNCLKYVTLCGNFMGRKALLQIPVQTVEKRYSSALRIFCLIPSFLSFFPWAYKWPLC